MPMWQSYPSNSSFWSPFLPLQETQNLRLQINLSLGAWYCQTTGSASRRLLNSPAQLPRPSEAWHARKGSPVGTAGCPCQLLIRISSSATLQLPTPFCQEGTRRRKDQTQESGGLHPAPPPVCLVPPNSDSIPEKGTFRVPSGSILKVHFQSCGTLFIAPGTEKLSCVYRRMGKRTSLETKETLKWTVTGFQQRKVWTWWRGQGPQDRLGVYMPSSVFFPIETLQ